MADIDHQPQQDLTGTAANKKIKEIGEAARTCMFITEIKKFPMDARPMSLQKIEEDGSAWFLSSSESKKNADIAADSRVMLSFHNESKYQFLALYGTAVIHKDRPTIDKYWTDFANAWFDGKDDPRVTVIEVKPKHGEYWDTQDGKIVAFAKMSWSALTGAKVDDGGIQGTLQPAKTLTDKR